MLFSYSFTYSRVSTQFQSTYCVACYWKYDFYFWTGLSTKVETDGPCKNLPKKWIQRALSVDTLGTCASLCTDLDCEGTCVRVYPAHGEQQLSTVNMAGKTSSVKTCFKWSIKLHEFHIIIWRCAQQKYQILQIHEFKCNVFFSNLVLFFIIFYLPYTNTIALNWSLKRSIKNQRWKDLQGSIQLIEQGHGPVTAYLNSN